VAKSRDVEVLEGKSHFIEFGGNLVPVTKSGEQVTLNFTNQKKYNAEDIPSLLIFNS
jgi:hypothetical protein